MLLNLKCGLDFSFNGKETNTLVYIRKCGEHCTGILAANIKQPYIPE